MTQTSQDCSKLYANENTLCTQNGNKMKDFCDATNRNNAAVDKVCGASTPIDCDANFKAWLAVCNDTAYKLAQLVNNCACSKTGSACLDPGDCCSNSCVAMPTYGPLLYCK